MYNWLIHFAVQQKLTQQCKPITLQLKKKFKSVIFLEVVTETDDFGFRIVDSSLLVWPLWPSHDWSSSCGIEEEFICAGAKESTLQHTEMGLGRCVWLPDMWLVNLCSEEGMCTNVGPEDGETRSWGGEPQLQTLCWAQHAVWLCGAWYNRFCGGAMKKLFILQNN